jgi:poly-gamma-glutamate biosynthesis protein PgsC/CapC
MIPVLSVAIGVGLAVSLIFSEMFGLAAGGMVVPGYFALYLDQPLDVILTIVVGMGTYLVVHLMSTFIIIFGRRRTVLMILTGYLLRLFMDALPYDAIRSAGFALPGSVDFKVIGYIVPGLIAIWMDRQGLVETLSALLTASVVVRLILILVLGADVKL